MPSNQPEPQNRDNQFSKLKTSSYQPSPSTPQRPSSQRSSSKQPRWWLRIILAAVLIAAGFFIVLFGWNLRNLSQASSELFGSSNVLGFVPPQQVQTDQAGRTNILLIGNAADQDTHGGADLTDTILLLSLSKDSPDYMLSVPRDLYVSLPGGGMGKINEVYPFGQRTNFTHPQYRDGGMGALELLIDEIFGLTVHYSMVVNFSAVEEIVDALGGITVTIDSPDERGLYDPNFQPEEGGPLRLENGIQEIDGQTALRLTRARGAAGGYGFPESDFNRTRNQQAVVKGIIDQLEFRWLLDPRNNKPLLEAASNTIELDVPMNQAISLARQLYRTQLDDIATYTLRDIEGQNLLISYRTPGGLAALIPAAGIEQYLEIRSAITEIHR